MASTLCQNGWPFFYQKRSKFCTVRTNFVQILTACGPNTYQIWYIKYPIGKSIFAVNLLLKLFLATVANADIGSLKSLHTFLKECLYHMLVKFEQNWMVQTTWNFEPFDKKKKKKKKKKTCFLKPFLSKRSRHFGRRFCSWNIYLFCKHIFVLFGFVLFFFLTSCFYTIYEKTRCYYLRQPKWIKVILFKKAKGLSDLS